ncbi:hypothetical protein HPB50_028412 [Hyalomma asiaticum]|nr:hypothetical protein HPB50_028412 [Hyalomma asiaticum]
MNPLDQRFSKSGPAAFTSKPTERSSPFEDSGACGTREDPVVCERHSSSFAPPEESTSATVSDCSHHNLTAGVADLPTSAVADVDSILGHSPDISVSSEASSASSDGKDYGDEDLGRTLQEWAVEHRIKRDALSGLLKRLKPHHAYLPIDARTLLRTP